MKKYSLFGFLTYVLEFTCFFALCGILSIITKEEVIALIGVYCLSDIYVVLSIRRARRSDLNFQSVMESTLTPLDFMARRNFLSNLIPLLLAYVLDLTMLGCILACIIVGFILFGKNSPARILTVFLKDIDAYKLQIEEKQIILLIDNRKIGIPVINIDDTIEFAHIAGDYYLLKNIIRKDQQNDDIEENNEDKLLEA